MQYLKATIGLTREALRAGRYPAKGASAGNSIVGMTSDNGRSLSGDAEMEQAWGVRADNRGLSRCRVNVVSTHSFSAVRVINQTLKVQCDV